ncbi:MAG TPA: FAD/NAD(P)-binding protein [Sedimentisphaerales bacterium]|nr:FAD/NAD(P)-binding protein [Sedimentisphaerales bacterium]
MSNEYIPCPARIESVRDESFDTKTFKVVLENAERARSFNYKPGQFVQMSILGIGEAPISITSSPHQQGFLEFTIRRVGRLTHEIHKLMPGERVYIRGPYGNSFPLEQVRGKDLCFIAGGIGLPPLRSLINAVFHKRRQYGKIKILYGAKTPDELCFKEELKTWQRTKDTEVLLTVDRPDQHWKGNVGVVTTLWTKTDMTSSDGAAFVCGPPIMIRFVVTELLDSGFTDDNIYMTLERYMKCGIGKCGHCNIGARFVCIDGAVFTYAQLRDIPAKERCLF